MCRKVQNVDVFNFRVRNLQDLAGITMMSSNWARIRTSIPSHPSHSTTCLRRISMDIRKEIEVTPKFLQHRDIPTIPYITLAQSQQTRYLLPPQKKRSEHTSTSTLDSSPSKVLASPLQPGRSLVQDWTREKSWSKYTSPQRPGGFFFGALQNEVLCSPKGATSKCKGVIFWKDNICWKIHQKKSRLDTGTEFQEPRDFFRTAKRFENWDVWILSGESWRVFFWCLPQWRDFWSH